MTTERICAGQLRTITSFSVIAGLISVKLMAQPGVWRRHGQHVHITTRVCVSHVLCWPSPIGCPSFADESLWLTPIRIAPAITLAGEWPGTPHDPAVAHEPALSTLTSKYPLSWSMAVVASAEPVPDMAKLLMMTCSRHATDAHTGQQGQCVALRA